MKKLVLLAIGFMLSTASFCQAQQNQTNLELSYKDATRDNNSNYYDIVKEQRANFTAVKAERQLTLAEKKSYKHFERWAYFWKDRVSADGHFPSALKGYEAAQLLDFSNTKDDFDRRAGSVDSWTNIGPKTNPDANGFPNPPQMGRINTFWRYVDAGNAANNVLIVGAPTGGIWKSTDNGATWSPKFDNFAGIGITDIKGTSNDKNTAGVLYATTGDYDGAEVLNSIGVFKSTDMGETWTVTGLKYDLKDNELLGHLVVYDANTVVVATKNSIKRTINGGTTWTDVYTQFNDQFFGRMASFADTIVCSDAIEGLHFSIDKGSNWSELVAPNNDGKHAVTADENGSFYVQDKVGQIKSVDFANKSVTNVGTIPSGYSAQQGFNQVLVKRGNIMVDGSVNGNSSADNGSTWYQALNGYKTQASDPGIYVHSDHHQAGYLDTGLSFWFAHDGGLSFINFASNTDQSPTATYKSNGVIVTQIYAISIDPTDSTSDDFMMANQDNDGFSKEAGKWVSVQAGDGVASAIDYTNPNIRYLGGTEGSLVRSDAALGFTTSYQGTQLTTPGNAEFVWPLSLHTTTSTTLYGGFDELYVSTNKGDNWTSLTSGAGKITSFDNQGDFIAAKGNSGTPLRFSSNAGSTWSSIAEPEAGVNINSFSIDAASTNGSTIYATVKGYEAGKKVYKSTDSGQNWTNISGTLPNVVMKKVLFKQNATKESLYVGTELGVYYTEDGGSTWKILGKNLPSVIVNDLKINYLNDKLFIGTYGRGMWEIPLSVKKDTLIVSTTNAFAKSVKVFPNPTLNKTINVEMKQSKGKTYSYTIYNVVGGIISNGILGKNNTINIPNTPKGTYILTVSDGTNDFNTKISIQ